jgi:hypothetical protein
MYASFRWVMASILPLLQTRSERRSDLATELSAAASTAATMIVPKLRYCWYELQSEKD